MLTFQNPGLIDIRAATTMGINAKADNSAIGFFGTGLKYSIACILRWGGEITIWRGLEEFKFTATSCDIRDKNFSIVCMNGRELGFVTDYGKTWEPWQVYRELYTNTIDEKGEVFDSEILPTEDTTTILVSCEKLDEAHWGSDAFILRDTPLISAPEFDFHRRENSSVFYQNLRVSKLPLPSMFTYNIKRKVALTEDRTLQNAWEYDITVARVVDFMCQSGEAQNIELAQQIMMAPEGTWEQQVSYGLSSSGQRSEAFYKVAEKVMRHNATKLNHTILDLLKRRKPLQQQIDTFEPSWLQKSMLETSADFAETIGFPVRDYPIVCAERLGEGILGLAHEGTIYVTRHTFDLGTKMVAGTLIEEFIHLREGVKDYTRGMQEALLNRMVSLGEEHVWKKPL